MEKLVSIVLPTYNGEKYLADSIESVISQTYKNWELIIINDCSTDKTLEIAQSYAAKDNRIKVYSNDENLKVPKSLNRGFSLANGKYFTWTSDDNMYKPKAIEYMVNYLVNNNDTDMASCVMSLVSNNGQFEKDSSKRWERNQLELCKRCNIGACFMYTREIALKTGGYAENMFCAEDYDYWCRLALIGKIAYLDENLYTYRINSQSLSVKKEKQMLARTLDIRLKYFLGFMEKYNVAPKEQIKYILDAYKENREKQWLELGEKIDKKALSRGLVVVNFKYFLTKIFSMKNRKKHKIITILGFKIKIRRKKK